MGQLSGKSLTCCGYLFGEKVTWALGAVGFFGALLVLDVELVKGTKEAYAVLLITVVFAGAPLALAFWLDYREAPEVTKMPDEEVESLLDFLDERDDLK